MARQISRGFSLEKEKAGKLLAKIRVSDVVYAKYRNQARKFMADFPGSRAAASPVGRFISAVLMRKSVLFGREFLTAYADPTWLQTSFPQTDAVAVPSIEFVSLPSPPLVLIPNAAEALKNNTSLSILEHEFVHVNQAISGTFPDSPKGAAEEVLEGILSLTRSEYEANLLQLTRWPQLYVRSGKKYGFSLESWSIFRGYTQSLEQTVLAVKRKQIGKGEFQKFLDMLPSALPAGFQRMGFNKELGEYCAARVSQHVSTAIQILNSHINTSDARPALEPR